MLTPLPIEQRAQGELFIFLYLPMSKVPYSKGSLTYSQQLDLLKSRGLIVENEPKALHLLETVSYYRLSGYWYPLLKDKEQHVFKKDVTFDIAFKLYCFDRKLRQLVLGELEKIEVAIRAKMTYILANKYGPFWFQDSSLFSNQELHQLSLSKMEEEFRRSDEEFIHAFKNKYSDVLPPSWIAFEITSFGGLSKLYQNLRSSREKREIAHHFGLPDVVFLKWIHSIVYLRNICAHHTRLWNRSMSIRPPVPNRPHNPWINTERVMSNKAYFILSMIKYLLQTANPHNTFKSKLKSLLVEYPNVDVFAMGFPINWEQEPLWID